jgi:hypothetical protein
LRNTWSLPDVMFVGERPADEAGWISCVGGLQHAELMEREEGGLLELSSYEIGPRAASLMSRVQRPLQDEEHLPGAAGSPGRRDR